MFSYLSSPYFQVVIGLVGLVLILILLGRLFPRPLRSALHALDRWSGCIVMALGLLVLICGSVGFGLEQSQEKDISLPLAMYDTLQIFAFNYGFTQEQLNTSPMLQAAMVCAILLAITVGAKGIALLFHESYVQLQLRWSTGHVMILGLGRIARQIIADLVERKDSRAIVVIERDPENPDVAWAREQGAIVIVGDGTKKDSLESGQIHRADEVFVVTGSDDCNIECVIEIREILARRGRKNWLRRKREALRCHVHVLSRDLSAILRKKLNFLEDQEKLDVEVFNALERTARRLLEDMSTATISGVPIRPVANNEFAHVVLLGFGEFGQTLALKLAELAHFENGKRLRMTIVDREIAKTAQAFVAQHPQFSPEVGQIPAWRFDSQCDDWNSTVYRPVKASQLPEVAPGQKSPGIEYVCNAQYVEYLEATDPSFLQGMNSCFRTPGTKPIILVCFEDDRQNFAIAERLREKLEQEELKWPVFVWIPRQRELSQLLNRQRESQNTGTDIACNIIPFGQCYGSVSYAEITDSWSEWLAHYLHLLWLGEDSSIWRPSVAKFQQAIFAPDAAVAMRALDWKELDRVAKDGWEQCDEWARASNRSSAIHAVLKVAALGLQIEGLGDMTEAHPEITVSPELDEQLRMMEHYRWTSERLIAGWHYDEERNDTKKTRWQITSWESLERPPQSVIDAATAKGKKVNEKIKDERIVRLVIALIKSGKLTLKKRSPAKEQ